MDRRNFLAACGAGIAAASLNQAPVFAMASKRNTQKPNIIWIVVEDICLELGCYGHKIVKTPNIDKFAAEGIMYTNAFATSAVCSPARSAFFTGMYQTSIGAHHHRSHLDDGYQLPKPVRLLSDYLRDAGYFTMLMGPKQKTDFNFNPAGPVFDATDGERSSAMGAYTHAPIDSKIFDGPAWKAYPGDKPFFAQINYSEAHRTFISDPLDPIDPGDVELPPYYPDHPIARRDWALYLETIQVLDKKIGNLMKEIHSKGLDENTLIILFGDHGRPMLRGKQWLYEGGIHVPLIVWQPGSIEASKVSDDLVSLIDLAPTTLKVAGIEPPEHMQGKVFLGKGAKERKYIFAAKDRCDEVDDRVRCVRDKQYKYIRNFHPQLPFNQLSTYKRIQYPVMTLMRLLHEKGKLNKAQARFMAPSRPKEELYDLKTDPHEFKNLAFDPAHKNILLEMRKALDDWIVETKDQGEIPESPEIIKYWDDFFDTHYEKIMRQRGLSPNISHKEYLSWWDKELTRLENGG